MSTSEAKHNPLAPKRPVKERAEHPMMAHAKVWQHVQGMDPDQLMQATDATSYATPILATLSSKPNVKAKDVIKAVAQATADGKIPPSQAIEFISQIPPEQEKLRPWLRGLYAINLTALVHMKSAMLQQAQQAQQPQQAAPQPSAPAAPSAAPATAPGLSSAPQAPGGPLS